MHIHIHTHVYVYTYNYMYTYSEKATAQRLLGLIDKEGKGYIDAVMLRLVSLMNDTRIRIHTYINTYNITYTHTLHHMHIYIYI